MSLLAMVVCGAICGSLFSQIKKIPNIMTPGNCEVISRLMIVRLMTFAVVNGIGHNGLFSGDEGPFVLLEGIGFG